jgi:hypothetical protein
MSKGSLKSVGTVVLDHSQRGAPSIDVVHMEHVVSLKKVPPRWQGFPTPPQYPACKATLQPDRASQISMHA